MTLIDLLADTTFNAAIDTAFKELMENNPGISHNERKTFVSGFTKGWLAYANQPKNTDAKDQNKNI